MNLRWRTIIKFRSLRGCEMVNLIESMGYNVENVHNGLIVYLCNLWNEGIKEPFNSFCYGLGIKSLPGKKLYPVREHKNIDLVIFEDKDYEKPFLVIEMKVDSGESGTDKSQTDNHLEKIPNAKHYLFITLGIGECFGKLNENKFRWIKLKKFNSALNKIRNKDKIIEDWKEVIHREIILRKYAIRNNNKLLHFYRPKIWNIYVLHELLNKCEIINYIKKYKPRIYIVGSSPDTILNFCYDEDLVMPYLEINNKGILNLKMNFADIKNEDKKRKLVDSAYIKFFDMFKEFNPSRSNRGQWGGTKTVMKLDVGLGLNADGNIYYVKSIKQIGNNINTILKRFAKYIK